MTTAIDIDCSVSMDGGSISLALKEHGKENFYTLNQSIKSMGTKDYELIHDSNGVLSNIDEIALTAKLEEISLTIPSENPCLEIVEEFLSVLRVRSANFLSSDC